MHRTPDTVTSAQFRGAVPRHRCPLPSVLASLVGGEKHLHVSMSLTALRTVLAVIEIRAVQIDPEACVSPAPRLRAVS